MSVRDLYFTAPKAAVEAMERANFRRVLLPGENLGVDFFFDPEVAIDLARTLSRTELEEPAWAMHATIAAEAFYKWRKNDLMARQLGDDDVGSLFVNASDLNEFSKDLIEPLEVLGGFA
jgi:hypothetical protein